MLRISSNIAAPFLLGRIAWRRGPAAPPRIHEKKPQGFARNRSAALWIAGITYTPTTPRTIARTFSAGAGNAGLSKYAMYAHITKGVPAVAHTIPHRRWHRAT
jgi:hypothetical protein